MSNKWEFASRSKNIIMADEQQLELIEECNVLVCICTKMSYRYILSYFQRRELSDLMSNDFDRILNETSEILKVRFQISHHSCLFYDFRCQFVRWDAPMIVSYRNYYLLPQFSALKFSNGSNNSWSNCKTHLIIINTSSVWKDPT